MHLKEITICSCLILERKKPNKLAYKFSNGLFFRAEQWRLGTKLIGINKKTLITPQICNLHRSLLWQLPPLLTHQGSARVPPGLRQ